MRFVDIYPPTRIKGYPCYSVPQFSTTLVEAGSGNEDANENWENALQHFRLPEAIRCHEDYAALLTHWYCMRGPARLWPFRDPLDFASVELPKANVTPTLTLTDQVLGVADGLTRDFQLIRTYATGGETYVREIQLPILSTVLIGMDGATPALAPGGPWAYTVEREGGNVHFNDPPLAGTVITAGFLFDVPVRFENDTTLEGIVKGVQVSGFADLTLIERRLC